MLYLFGLTKQKPEIPMVSSRWESEDEEDVEDSLFAKRLELEVYQELKRWDRAVSPFRAPPIDLPSNRVV